MSSPVPTRTRRLALLFTVPLAFSLLFFAVNIASEHTGIRLLALQSLSAAVNRLRSLAQDAESGERGFLLTGDEHYLLPLDQGSAWLPDEIHLCLMYARERPELEGEIRRLTTLVQKRFDEANQVLTAQRAKGFATALEITRSGASEQTMNEIRRTADDLQTKLNAQQLAYLDRQRNVNRWAFALFLVGTLVMIVVLVWLYNALLSYIRARDRAHAQLQALNAELEARIEERTRELQRSNEELQQFAYVASHDLQEPLRTITSFTQLLETRFKGQMGEDADEFIQYIVNASRRMTDLINGLLAIVRLRKEGQPTAPVSFEKLLDEAEVTLQGSIRETGARIEHGPLPSLVVDHVQLLQLLQNLLSNAIKYRRSEPPLIRVEAKRDSTNWTFSVSDNGQGFDQQFAERIFGLFQRLHRGPVEGTGMGLSIARRIVERHGGRIWAESKPGVGSTFYFSLPVSLESSRHVSLTESESAVAK